MLITIKQVVSEFARWSIRQSPYLIPENLDKAIEYFEHHLVKTIDMYNGNEAKIIGDIVEIGERRLSDVISDIIHNNPYCQSWNMPKAGTDHLMNGTILFSSAFGPKYTPDQEFIDLDALRMNIMSAMIKEDARDVNEAKVS